MTSSTPCARIPRARDCSTPARSMACTCRTTTAITGSRCNAEPSRHSGLGPDRHRPRSRDRNARPRLLHPRQHRDRCGNTTRRWPRRPTSCCSRRTRQSASSAPAAIQYLLKHPAQAVRIDILDAQGPGRCARIPDSTADAGGRGRGARPVIPRGGGGGRGRGGFGNAGAIQERRPEHLQLGPTLRAGNHFPGMILWGGTHEWPAGAAGHVHACGSPRTASQ